MLNISDILIRPNRRIYDPNAELGPKTFTLEGRVYRRTDLKVQNYRGLLLDCSFFEAIGAAEQKLPCIVYCHGCSGTRMDAMDIAERMLPRGFNIFVFDFAGSGMSQGKYVTLGFNE